jgi:tRNA pseudouridine55 synthase
MNVIINFNKPAGITSHTAVTKVKRLLGAQKAGHTGTLDPMATGVLLVCLNEATKVARFLIDMDKEYNARLKIGERTDTYDSQGRIIEKKNISSLTEAYIVETVMKFVGSIKQKPPMHSAVKVGGKTLYKLARKGLKIERPERSVEIYGINIREITIPYVDLTVLCSKGTYIRTLCDDIGKKLSKGAHLVSLERTRIGNFDIKNSALLDDLENGNKFFYSIDNALSEINEIILSEADYRKAKNGVQILSNKIDKLNNNEFIKLKGPAGNLFGLGIVYSGIIKIERILNL